MRFKNTVFLWLPVIIWASFIFYLSSIPQLELTSEPIGNFLTRKTGHIVEFAVLGSLILRALKGKNYYLAILLSVVYGIFDETHQTFVPTREFHFSDIGFDAAGVIIGIFSYAKRGARKERAGARHF